MFVRTLILLFAVLLFAPTAQAQMPADDCLSYERVDSSCQERLGLVEPLGRFERHVAEAMHALGLSGERAFVVTNYDNTQAPFAWYQPLKATALMPAHLFHVQVLGLMSGEPAMEYAALNAACQALYVGTAQELDVLLGHPRGYHAAFEASVENQCVKRLVGDSRFSRFMTPASNYNVAGRS
jgi:hypothetical protein